MRSSKPLEIGPATSLRAPREAPPKADQAPARAGDASPKAYDQRLFARGPDGPHHPSRAGWLRGCARRLYVDHHLSRFRWLEREVASLGLRSASVLELGCFDGRTIDHIPIEITRYVGLDAGWESGLVDGREVGLEAARRRYADDSRFHFLCSAAPADLRALPYTFDFGICMETFEHVEPALVEEYVVALAEKVAGPLFVTVPNEESLALLIKIVGRKLLRVRYDPYTLAELFHALRGRPDLVDRHDHKGFDYQALAALLGRHFGRVEQKSVHLPWLPAPLRLTVGMVAGPGRRAARRERKAARAA